MYTMLISKDLERSLNTANKLEAVSALNIKGIELKERNLAARKADAQAALDKVRESKEMIQGLIELRDRLRLVLESGGQAKPVSK